MRYRIDPEGVHSVLVATLTPVRALGTALGPLQGAVDQVGAGAGGSAEIISALDSLMGAENDRLEGMVGRVDNCLTGAAQATAAYVEADGRMSESTRRAQSEAVETANALPQ